MLSTKSSTVLEAEHGEAIQGMRAVTHARTSRTAHESGKDGSRVSHPKTNSRIKDLVARAGIGAGPQVVGAKVSFSGRATYVPPLNTPTAPWKVTASDHLVRSSTGEFLGL